jgi:hypothetical protein
MGLRKRLRRLGFGVVARTRRWRGWGGVGLRPPMSSLRRGADRTRCVWWSLWITSWAVDNSVGGLSTGGSWLLGGLGAAALAGPASAADLRGGEERAALRTEAGSLAKRGLGEARRAERLWLLAASGALRAGGRGSGRSQFRRAWLRAGVASSLTAHREVTGPTEVAAPGSRSSGPSQLHQHSPRGRYSAALVDPSGSQCLSRNFE